VDIPVDKIGLEKVLKGIQGGDLVFRRIEERISLFNDFAADLTVKEMREDMLKLLADAQILISSLVGDVALQNRMRELLIPNWDAMFCIIEKFVLQSTYDMLFFLICKTNHVRDDTVSRIMKDAKYALLGAGMDLSLPVATFKQIEHVRSPLEKICVLEETFTLITSSKQKASFSSDELLPIFITCVLRAQVSTLFSNLDVITGFSFEKRVEQGETGYLLATLEACGAYILENRDYLVSNSSFFQKFASCLASRDIDQIQAFYNEQEFPKHIDKYLHSFCDENGRDAVMICIDEPALVELFLTRYHFNANFQTCPSGDSYLHYCASRNLIASASILMEKNASCTLKNSNGETAFSVAIEKGHIDFCKFLLSHTQDLKGMIPIPKTFEILHQDAVDSLTYLLTFPINTANVFIGGDKSLLSYFCASSRPNLAVSLLKKCQISHLVPTSQDHYSRTFLHYCSTIDANLIVAMEFFRLASKEIAANVTRAADIDGNTSLQVAVLNENLGMVRLLLENGADLEVRNRRDLAAYELASTDSQIQAALLLEKLKRQYQRRRLAISIYTSPSHQLEASLVFIIRSGVRRDPDNISIVKRSLDDFSLLRRTLITERPELLLYVFD
jgi:ankyrin repeat protein